MMNTILSIVSAIVLLGLVALIVMYARRSAKTAEKAAALAERSYELRLIEAAERGLRLPAQPPITATPSTLAVGPAAAACRLDAFARSLDQYVPSAIYPFSVDPLASATASGGRTKQGTVH